MKVLTIGIAGGTGSGKTTLAQNIVSHFGERITLICHDDYYKAHDELPYSEREKLNYDHPDAFDTPLPAQKQCPCGTRSVPLSAARFPA